MRAAFKESAEQAFAAEVPHEGPRTKCGEAWGCRRELAKCAVREGCPLAGKYARQREREGLSFCTWLLRPIRVDACCRLRFDLTRRRASAETFRKDGNICKKRHVVHCKLRKFKLLVVRITTSACFIA
jgi:hypothetical protein